MAYVELHAHDEWSLLDGVGTAIHGATRAAECGHPALAKTNHAVLSGVVHHMKACRDVGITPIVAVEAYYREKRASKQWIDAARKRGENVEQYWSYYHMVLLAKDIRGWRSLMLLTSEAYRSGYYRYPCIDDELLDKWNEGLIISTSCISGFIPRAIGRGDEDAVNRHADKLDKWVGDDWYIELQPHDFDDLRAINLELPKLAVVRSKPLVATKDAHFPEPSWHATQDVSVKIRTRSSFQLAAKAREAKGDDYYDLTAPATCYIGTAEDTVSLFKRYHPLLEQRTVEEAVANTGVIASQITPFLLDRRPKVPRFLPTRDESYERLRELVYQGLAETDHLDPVYTKQAEHELEILRQKDFCDFFLITWDFIRWARSTDPLPATEEDPSPQPRERPMVISVRGSAGGSIVSYALRIITINPITWGLKFERFLNPDREGLPDIDLDFAPGDADLVKEYIKRKWGRDKVYDMVAHGTMAAKAAVGRVARVYDVPYPEANAITKKIDKTQNDSDLADLRHQIVELDRFFEKYPDVFRHASRLQRSIGTISEHAAGVVLSDRPLDELMPVMKKSVEDDYLVTAFGEASDSQIVSSLGFLKLDLLVVIELAKLAYAAELVGKHYDIDLQIDKLPIWEDPYAVDAKTMDLFHRGLMMGVFQYGGSAGITAATKKTKPDHLFHLCAINAVHRPATMVTGVESDYIRRRHDPSRVEYWDPSVEPILAETYGMMIYQEQTQDIMVTLGGFSPARSDNVRRIMSKYYREKGDVAVRMLEEHHSDFVDNASTIMEGGREAAENVWGFAGGFSGYAFNKCVSAQTLVERSSGGKYCSDPKVSIGELYAIQEGPSTSMRAKLRRQGLQILQMSDDGRVRPGRMNKIHCNGRRELFRVKTACGRSIDATSNHRLLAHVGYAEVGLLSVGDKLVLMGETEGYRKVGNQTERARGKSYENCGFEFGEGNVSWIDGRTVMLAEAKSVVRERARGRCEHCGWSPGEAKHALEMAHVLTLEQCAGRMERYHSADNIKHLCNSCHKSFDYAKGERKKRWSKGRPTFLDEIVSIESIGEHDVYDVEMDTPEHNFVANGIVSHNSHSAQYAILGYADAYIKANWTDCFYASLLTFPPAKIRKPEERKPFYEKTIREARLLDTRVLPPDVNYSSAGFTVTPDGLRFGLGAIKGMGAASVNDILEGRPFESYSDFKAYTSRKGAKCNASGHKALGASGALDRWGVRDDLTPEEQMAAEENRLGVILSAPDKIGPMRDELAALIHTQGDFEEMAHGAVVCVGGEIIGGKEVNTRKGPALKLDIAFGAEEYRVSVAPWHYDAAIKALIDKDEPVIVRGTKDAAYDTVQCDSIELARDVLALVSG